MFSLHFTGMCFPLVFLIEWWRWCLQSWAKYQALSVFRWSCHRCGVWIADFTTDGMINSLLCTNWLRSIWTNHNNIVMLSVAALRTPASVSHSPWRMSKGKKKCITFDTNFDRYLPRGTIIDGSWKYRIGAFCTIAKISGEMPKKGLKTGQNCVKFFF